MLPPLRGSFLTNCITHSGVIKKGNLHMQIRHFFVPGLAINSYMIFDEESMQGAIIDPTPQIESYLSTARQEKIEIIAIIETHVHADFVSGAPELKAALQGKPLIYCSGMGGKEWIPYYADRIIQDRNEVSLGKVRLQAYHTPGHTHEHLIWVAYDERRNPSVPSLVFTGDLLFVGSVGRPDLLGPQEEELLIKQLYRSLFTTLQTLPEFIEIYPGHGAGSPCGKSIGKRDVSTLGYEMRCNPWLQPMDISAWSQRLINDLQTAPAAPAYFKHMKHVNVHGLDLKQQANEKEIPMISTKEDFLKVYSSCDIIDIRSGESFAKGHLKGAINIPFGEQFPLWCGAVLSEKKGIILMVDSPVNVSPVVQSLRLIGKYRIAGVCIANQWPWEQTQELTATLTTVTPEQVRSDLSKFFILDVRTPNEWNSGHIQEAHHMELTRVPQNLDRLPKEAAIAVICRSGARASLIASLLAREGFDNPVNIRGGMVAWNKMTG